MKNLIYIITILVFNLLPVQKVLAIYAMDIESFINADLKGVFDPNLDIEVYGQYNLEEKIRNADPQKLLGLITNCNKETSHLARRKALIYEVKIANLHPTKEIRQEVVNRLVTTMVEPNSVVGHDARELLLDFSKDTFNTNTKDILHNALAQKNPSRQVIEICGIADMKEELPRLKELTIDEIEYSKSNDPFEKVYPFYLTNGWEARLARARMGIKEDIIKCIELSESVKDINERVLRLLPGIGYIRQPEAIEYLKKYLDSDEQLAPLSPGRPGIPVSHYTLRILSESLKNFPDVWQGGKDIEYYRKWASEQKEWQIIR